VYRQKCATRQSLKTLLLEQYWTTSACELHSTLLTGTQNTKVGEIKLLASS